MRLGSVADTMVSVTDAIVFVINTMVSVVEERYTQLPNRIDKKMRLSKQMISLPMTIPSIVLTDEDRTKWTQ